MSNDTAPTPDYKLVGPLAIVFDAALTAVFFLWMCTVTYSHTPDFSERGKIITAAYTASCIAGVFWLCVQGFRVTIVDQMKRKKLGIKS
ncbi:MAG TPA: hypothetical protein VK737_04780 [Opitutales bacterium]|jgi:hypothetical protein|nr:hypothetical protein [Opitutales bacterium]